MKKLLIAAVVVLLFLSAVVGIAVVRFDAASVIETVESGLAAVTGRSWQVSGGARFVPGLTPVIEVGALRTPNETWATKPDFVTVGTIRLESQWLSLITGRPVVTTVRIADVEVNLETDGDGDNNWRRSSGTDPQRSAPPQAIAPPTRVVIERTLVRFHSGWADAGTAYPIGAINIEMAGPTVPLAISVDARVKDQPLSVGGKLGSPAAMFNGKPFEIALNGRYSGSESNADVVIDGRVGRLSGLEDLNLEFTLKADSLNEVGSISGFELPRDTPVSITAAVVNTGAGPALADYVLRIGQAIIRPQD